MQSAAHEARLSARCTDGVSHEPELVVERGLVGARRRREVRREELEPDATVAADESEAAALALGARDGGGPVDADAELARRQPEAVRADGERHGRARERLCAAL